MSRPWTRLRSRPHTTMIDPRLRGASELLHLIRSHSLTLPEVCTYCQLLWEADREAIASTDGFEPAALRRLEQLRLLAFCRESRFVMLNPHVAQIGGPLVRGRLRKKFRQLMEG